MKELFVALARGRYSRPAQVAFRLTGLCGLGGACAIFSRVHRFLAMPPPHQAAPLDLAWCLGAIVLLWLGLALVIEGPGLFRDVPRPPRALLP